MHASQRHHYQYHDKKEERRSFKKLAIHENIAIDEHNILNMK